MKLTQKRENVAKNIDEFTQKMKKNARNIAQLTRISDRFTRKLRAIYSNYRLNLPEITANLLKLEADLIEIMDNLRIYIAKIPQNTARFTLISD